MRKALRILRIIGERCDPAADTGGGWINKLITDVALAGPLPSSIITVSLVSCLTGKQLDIPAYYASTGAS